MVHEKCNVTNPIKGWVEQPQVGLELFSLVVESWVELQYNAISRLGLWVDKTTEDCLFVDMTLTVSSALMGNGVVLVGCGLVGH